jgi:threonine/homoserine/homoserine lactone efflux protein
MVAGESLFFHGFVLGLMAAAPIGPVNIEMIRRGLRVGFWAPFCIGMGAVTADFVYVTLASFGFSSLFSHSAVLRGGLMLLGAALLSFLGIAAMREARRPVLPTENPGQKPLGKAKYYLLGLLLCLANPMTIGYWLVVSAAFLPSGEALWRTYVILVVSVSAGCISWVLFISTVLHVSRSHVSSRLFQYVNLVSGLLLVGYGLYFALKFIRLWAS